MPGRFNRGAFRRLWVVPIVVAILVVAGLWSLRKPASSGQAPSPGSVAPSGSIGRTPIDPSGPLEPLEYVRARIDTRSSTNLDQLVKAYALWRSRPDAFEARRLIVQTLLQHRSLALGLHLLLTAAEADQTPRERDPLWSTLVRSVASRWDAETFTLGRDLVQIETRPKARDLVLESLAQLSPEKLTARQRPQLASDFIDLYPGLPSDQKALVSQTLQVLAGNDVVEILAGRGLSEGDSRLEVIAERQRQLDLTRRNPVREVPPEE